MIRKRLAALEARSTAGTVSLTVRAWLGHALTTSEQELAGHEAEQPAPAVDWSSMSKEAREWLQG